MDTTGLNAMKKTINMLPISFLLILACCRFPDASGADVSEGEVYVAGQTFTLKSGIEPGARGKSAR